MAFLNEEGLAELWSLVKSAMPLPVSNNDYEVTFLHSAWEDDGNGNWINGVEAFEFTSEDRPIADVRLSHTGDVDADLARLEAWGKVMSIKAVDGYIYLYANEIPEVSLPVRIKVVK